MRALCRILYYFTVNVFLLYFGDTVSKYPTVCLAGDGWTRLLEVDSGYDAESRVLRLPLQRQQDDPRGGTVHVGHGAVQGRERQTAAGPRTTR